MLGTKRELDVVSRAAALCSPPAQHDAALRAGWNDAAWGQPRREIETAVTPWYENGYAGGLVFRQKREHDTSARDVMGWLPRVVWGQAEPNQEHTRHVALRPRRMPGRVTNGKETLL